MMQLLIALVLPILPIVWANDAMECCPPTELFFELNNAAKDSCHQFSNGKQAHFWIKDLCKASVCEDMSEPAPCCGQNCDAACCNCKGSCKKARKPLVFHFKAEHRSSIHSVHINECKLSLNLSLL